MIAQENLKLDAFLFHQRWKCTLDWEITGVHEDTVCLMSGQKKRKDQYKDPDMLPKINKYDMAGIWKPSKNVTYHEGRP